MKLNFDRFEQCLGKISERGKIQPDEAKQILSEVANRAEQMRRTGVADPFVKAAGELAQNIDEVIKSKKREAILNAQTRKGIQDQIVANGGIENAHHSLLSRLVFDNKSPVGKVVESVQSLRRGLTHKMQAAMDLKLRQANLSRVVTTGAIDQEVARGMWRADGPEANALGKEAGAILKAPLELIRTRLNALGAQITDAMDYVAHTTYNAAQIRAAAGTKKSSEEAFDEWWNRDSPRMAEKTFDNVVPRPGESISAARKRFGWSLYTGIISGVHLKPEGALGLETDNGGMFISPFESGAGNIAKRVSQPRVVYWKGPDEWLAHMQEFGGMRTLYDSINRSIDTGARQIALMKQFGTNPRDTLERSIKWTKEQYKNEDPDAVKKFDQSSQLLRNVMGRLDGSLNVPVNETGAMLASSARALETTFHLGSVAITHLASIWPTVTSELVHHGVGRLQGLGNMIGALIKGRGSEERQQLLSEIGAFYHGSLAQHLNSFHGPDDVPGRVSALAGLFMKSTGIHYVFDNTQAGVKSMLAHVMGRDATKTLGELDQHLQNMYGQYGIGEKEWDIIRSAPTYSVEGRSYITPNSVENIPSAELAARLNISEIAATKLKQNLSDKMYSYLSDAGAHSVVSPGALEQAQVLGNTRPGTPAGEFWRFFSQFKTWPIAVMNQVIGREIYQSLSKGEAAWNIGALLALTAAAGYARFAITNTVSGKGIPDVGDPQVLLRSLAMGGGLGIIGDELFGSLNQQGGFVPTAGDEALNAAGPVVGDAISFLAEFQKFQTDLFDQTPSPKGRFANMWPDLVRATENHIPFNNLFYTKGVLDYLLFYHLREAADPGWWERTNRKLEADSGRALPGYAPGKPIPFTPYGIGQ